MDDEIDTAYRKLALMVIVDSIKTAKCGGVRGAYAIFWLFDEGAKWLSLMDFEISTSQIWRAVLDKGKISYKGLL